MSMKKSLTNVNVAIENAVRETSRCFQEQIMRVESELRARLAHVEKERDELVAEGAKLVSELRKERARAMPQDVEVEPNPNPYEIVDHATGVEGNYCIGQRVAGAPAFWSFWNPSGWAGSGFVFTDKAAAKAVIGLLEKHRTACAVLARERARLNEVRKLAEESLRMRGVDKDKRLAILDRKLDADGSVAGQAEPLSGDPPANSDRSAT